MDNNDLFFIQWIYKQDGTVWKQLYGEEPVLTSETWSEKSPPSKPEKSSPEKPPKEHEKFDYDKLIAESTGVYRDWWVMWKRIHPEWALYPEEPKEPEIIIPPKPKVTFKPLSCKRCKHTWTPRSKEPPMTCPKCHSPYWNRERVKRPTVK